MKYIKQIWREMRAQPLIGAVTVGGTALAIFFMMVWVMQDMVKVVPVAPVGGRDLYLHGKYLCTQTPDASGQISSYGSYRFYKETFGNVPHTRAYAIFSEPEYSSFSAEGSNSTEEFPYRDVTEGYWQVFNFDFLAGRPFTAEEVNSNLPVAVVAKKVAEELYGDAEKAVGQELTAGRFKRYKIVGVVDNVSVIAAQGYGAVWFPIGAHGLDKEEMYGIFGHASATVLVDDPANLPGVRAEIARRYQTQIPAVKQYDPRMEIAPFGYPFTTAENARETGSNNPPEESKTLTNWMMCALILLIPAINLAGMTSSRLRRRVKEFGVRRAFGCTRARLMVDILVENFILTLAGGVAGLLLCAACMRGLGQYLLISYEGYLGTNPHIPMSLLFHWQVFGLALAACFLLNIISSGIPAWRASRLSPVAAIGGAVK